MTEKKTFALGNKGENVRVALGNQGQNVRDIVKSSPIQMVFMVAAGLTLAWLLPISYACYNFM
jgi:hypothetical protein